MSKSICFVLPKSEVHATGGYKMVYEYANRLADRGYTVSILYLNSRYLKRYRAPLFLKKLYFAYLTWREPRWFPLSSKVRKVSNYSRRQVRELLRSDVAIATEVATAPVVKRLFSSPAKLYYIQGYEVWNRSESYVHRTYALGMRNIVISTYLKNIVDRYAGTSSVLLPNPIDLDVYRVTKDPETRPSHSIALLYNPNPCKGFEDSLCVLLKLKQRYSDLRATVFGAYKRPDSLPDWVRYVENAKQQETVRIYNEAAVYLCSTISEGYGLTGLEAMACGCALASTDFEGVREYGKNGINCLLSPVGDTEAQFAQVCRLIEDTELRLSLIREGRESVKAFSWEKAAAKMEEMLCGKEE